MGRFYTQMVRFLFYGRDHHECVCDNSTGHTHRSHRLDRHRNACRDRHQCHEKKNRTIMLGATPMYAFYKVTWPEIKSGVFSGFLMAVTMSLDDFSITFFTKGARRQHPVDDALHRAAQGGCARNCTPCQPFCLHFFCFLS